MEELLKTDKTYDQSCNILCLELCVKDVNEATHEFLKKHQDLIQLSDIPSWKFPHINIEKLDILSVIEKYRSKNLSEAQKYHELLELLVDRVCFSLMTTCNLLKSTEPVSKGRLIITQDSNGKNDQNLTAHPNIGVLLKHLLETIGVIVDTQAVEKKIKNRAKKNEAENSLKICSTHSQTNESSGSACETCFIAQNILKFLATLMTESLSIFPEEKSEIMTFRDLKNNSWNLSQREFVHRWCQALQQDAKALKNNVTQVLEEKTSLEKVVEECKSTMEIGMEKQAQFSQDQKKDLKIAQDEAQNVKKSHQELLTRHMCQLTKLKDLETQFGSKVEECKIQTVKISSLTESLKRINGTHQKLHEVNIDTERQREELLRKVDQLEKTSKSLEERVAYLEPELEEKNQETEKLNKALLKKCRDEMQKEEMKTLLEKAKQQLENCKKDEDARKKRKEKDGKTIQKLTKEVTKLQEQVELLTLYPDLNGAINTPIDTDDEDPLEAMRNQVKSNLLRIGVLQGQTNGLKATLAKYQNRKGSKT